MKQNSDNPQGNFTEKLGGDRGPNLNPPPPAELSGVPSNVPQVEQVFVGRKRQLVSLHELLRQGNPVAISGMDGIGKTALAVQYSRLNLQEYAGGICWLQARRRDLAFQLTEYVRDRLGLTIPAGLNEPELLKWCWSSWRRGQVLLIFDDVVGRETITPFLPPGDDRFRALVTTEENWSGVQQLDLSFLERTDALQLLQEMMGPLRADAPIEELRQLCNRLGYLPLSLKLVGRLMQAEAMWTPETVLQELERYGLGQAAAFATEQSMSARMGVKAAFELSWEQLPALTELGQKLGCLLSGLGQAPIDWQWVVEAAKRTEGGVLGRMRQVWRGLGGGRKSGRDKLLEALKGLMSLNLVCQVDGDRLLLHSLIRDYLQQKLAVREDVDEIKRSIAAVLVAEAIEVPEAIAVGQVTGFAAAVPHWQHVTQKLLKWVEDDELIWPFTGLGRFYKGQGLSDLAADWFERCLEAVKARLGEKHPDVITSLNNLASLYYSQGSYERAEPLFKQVLKLTYEILGPKHPDIATGLNNLAALYKVRGYYKRAEPLFERALLLTREVLGPRHPDVAISLNNLASLYSAQRQYDRAEPRYRQALELRREVLGRKHPSVAASLNNLSSLYFSQGRYDLAEPPLLEALEICEEVLGPDHPNTIQFQTNLAILRAQQS